MKNMFWVPYKKNGKQENCWSRVEEEGVWGGGWNTTYTIFSKKRHLQVCVCMRTHNELSRSAGSVDHVTVVQTFNYHSILVFIFIYF